MLDAHNVYEIEFDVPARNREAFQDWLSGEVVAWVSHGAVGQFSVFQNEKGLSPEVKFVFEFETLQDWAAFAGSDRHEDAVNRLEALVENRNATLWRRASVKLDATLDRTATGRTDGGCDGRAINTVNSR
ncbi:hypothetical protein [Halorubrum sp. LN27]|uniref:hypothetical protein n=1 Tax=Halorubrum sp. LN27 TaxID=2801032 RepID=UPI00190E1CBA|nr:hypothetical protein [Halorubrum sp. LN27]